MLKIYGSDGVVKLEGLIVNEIEAGDFDPIDICVGWVESTPWQPVAGIRVVMEFDGEDGVWCATIAPFEHAAPCPWAVQIVTNEDGPVVTIDCPAGTPVTVDGEAP